MTIAPRKPRRKGKLVEYLFVLPAILFLLTFIVYPIVYNFVLSVCDIDLTFFAKHEYRFVGLDNYVKLFQAQDGLLLKALKNTCVFTIISIPFLVILSFLNALLLQKNTRLSRVSRSVMLIGYIIPQTISAMVFNLMFLKDGGIVNHVLQTLRWTAAPIGFLIDENWAMFVLILTNLWISIPFSMLLFIAGLGTLDNQIVEAAMIDGAGWWKRMLHIVLPSIKSTVTIVLTLGVINTFKVFDIVYIMTGGGPGNATQMLSTYAYKLSFSLFQYDAGAVVSCVLFILLFVVGLFYINSIERGDE